MFAKENDIIMEKVWHAGASGELLMINSWTFRAEIWREKKEKYQRLQTNLYILDYLTATDC